VGLRKFYYFTNTYLGEKGGKDEVSQLNRTGEHVFNAVGSRRRGKGGGWAPERLLYIHYFLIEKGKERGSFLSQKKKKKKNYNGVLGKKKELVLKTQITHSLYLRRKERGSTSTPGTRKKKGRKRRHLAREEALLGERSLQYSVGKREVVLSVL